MKTLIRIASLLRFAVPYGSVLLGYWWGVYIWYPGRPPNIFTTVAVVSLGLILTGTLVHRSRGPSTTRNRWRSAVLPAYAVFLCWVDPFIWLDEYYEVGITICSIVPLLLALFSTMRARAWLTTIGLALFIFVITAVLICNAQLSDTGGGFWSCWY